MGFALSAWIGAAIPRNAGWEEPDPSKEPTIAILIGTNGVHTEIVMPIISAEQDWRALFPQEDITAQRETTHVAVSWGERVFFLETRRWSDTNPITAISALTGGDGILHVAHYRNPAPSESYRALNLTPDQYRALTQSIAAQLVDNHRATRLSGYGSYDVFYDARGTYNLANTCNQWTADRLADAGVKTGLWTPLPGGVMQWVSRD